MASAPPSSHLCPLLLLLLIIALHAGGVRSYEVPEEKEDVFAKRACPAFLSFKNVAYLAGVTMELPCRCKPQQVHSVVWFYQKHAGGPEATKVLTDLRGNRMLDPGEIPHGDDVRSRFAIRLFSLLIFRAERADSGIYLCGSSHQDFFYAYDVDIQEARSLSVAPRPGAPQGGGEGERARRRAGGARPLYQAFTSYQRWSLCDRCGVPGEQVRAALCYVHSRFLHVRYRRANQTVVSCGSGAVPGAFNLSRESRPGAKLEVRGCNETCRPPAPPPSSTLLLVSFLGLRPSGVPVYYLIHPAEQVLTLGCPGSRPDLAVAWDRGSAPIYRFEHLRGEGRLYVDLGHHLVFTPAQPQDSGVYYCWLQGERSAEIRLLVVSRLGQGVVLDHTDVQSALRMVLMSYAAMTTVFSLLMVGRAGVRHFRYAGL